MGVRRKCRVVSTGKDPWFAEDSGDGGIPRPTVRVPWDEQRGVCPVDTVVTEKKNGCRGYSTNSK